MDNDRSKANQEIKTTVELPTARLHECNGGIWRFCIGDDDAADKNTPSGLPIAYVSVTRSRPVCFWVVQTEDCGGGSPRLQYHSPVVDANAALPNLINVTEYSPYPN